MNQRKPLKNRASLIRDIDDNGENSRSVSLKKNKPPKARRKKRSPDSAAWKPSSNKSNEPGKNVMAMRSDTAKTVMKYNRVVQVKTAAMVDLSMVQLTDTARLARTIKKAQEQEPSTPTHRNIRETIFDENGSPLHVKTPGGTVLTRTLSIGLFHFFDNRFEGQSPASNKHIVHEVDADHPITRSEAYAKVKKLYQAQKVQEAIITPQVIAESRKAKARNNNRRHVSQNSVMAISGKDKDGSATRYAETLPIAPGTKKNNSHLNDHANNGPKSQNDGNLAITTTHANTAMILAEEPIPALAKMHPKGVKDSTKSNHVRLGKENQRRTRSGKENSKQEYLQVATTIEKTLSVGDDHFDFKFNAQTETQPHKAFQDFTRSFFAEVTATDASPAPATMMPMKFFKRTKSGAQAPTQSPNKPKFK